MSGRTASMALLTTGERLNGLGLEADLAPCDPRDVQQVVDQAGEVLDLPIDHVLGPFEVVFRLQLAEELSRVADRRQGVAKLVGEHGQELILAAFGLQTARPRCRFSSVMSRPIFEAPMIRPEASRIGETVSETSMIVPSLRRRFVW